MLGVTGVGAVGAGMGVLVFDPADHAGANVASDRTAIKGIGRRWSRMRPIPSVTVVESAWLPDVMIKSYCNAPRNCARVGATI